MSKKVLTVALPGREYDIEIERGLLSRAGERCRALLPKAARLYVITDSNVAPLYRDRVADSLTGAGFQVKTKVVPAGEASKNADQLIELWEDMMAFGLTRTDAVVALGGGVVGDLAGFAAASILRGVDFIQIPTTLLAQVDSSVGGKVAIDLKAGKNLAGAFWQPRGVLIDPDCLDTLPDRTFSDGMAEVIKYGCIRDDDFFWMLDRCGGRAEQTPAGFRFAKGALRGVEIDLADCPDLGPILMVLGLFCEGETVIRNAGRLRLKESDRIAAMEQELRKFGGDIRSDGGTVTVRRSALHPPAGPLWGHNDHRVVMSLTVLAAAAGLPAEIAGAEAVAKSWPGFFAAMRQLGVEVESYAG